MVRAGAPNDEDEEEDDDEGEEEQPPYLAADLRTKSARADPTRLPAGRGAWGSGAHLTGGSFFLRSFLTVLPTKVRDTVRSRSDRTTTSPSLSECQTQRIEARLLLIIQRIVEFRERRLKGLRRGEGRGEPLLHCLDTTRGSQRLVGRATDHELFRRGARSSARKHVTRPD
jgi:hypothetical protein